MRFEVTMINQLGKCLKENAMYKNEKEENKMLRHSILTHRS